MPRLTLKKVNEAIQAKWPGVELVKGEGYFYVGAVDYSSDVALKIAGLYQTGIYGVRKLNDLSLDRWIIEVENILGDKFKIDDPFDRNHVKYKIVQ